MKRKKKSTGIQKHIKTKLLGANFSLFSHCGPTPLAASV